MYSENHPIPVSAEWYPGNFSLSIITYHAEFFKCNRKYMEFYDTVHHPDEIYRFLLPFNAFKGIQTLSRLVSQ